MRVLVVGGGITGLVLGHRLAAGASRRARPLEVTVLEAAERPGGHATTLREDGYVVECGPNAFLDRDREPETRALVKELGLEPRLVPAAPRAKRRFVLLGGRLRLVPDAPPALLRTDLLTLPGKLRMAFEPFVGGPVEGVEETVWEFAARRIGREAADRLVDTAVSGISAGDSRQLSVSAAFPMMTEMEREHGSLLRAMMARRSISAPRLLSFDGGLATLIDALAARLGPRLCTGAAVEALAPSRGGWQVRLASGETLAADRIALAIPAHAAARIVRGFDPALAGELEAFPFAGLAVVALAFRESDLPRPLDGYGYLVARDEGLDTLGVVWESSLFDGRTPPGTILMRCMLGGARRPAVVTLPEEELIRRARAEQAPVLGLTADPILAWVRPVPRAIAQYTRGHRVRVANVRAAAAQHPGLDLVGTSYDGISFTAAVASAERWAEAILESDSEEPGMALAAATRGEERS
jgi:protoporphyrinogen/coproporphyrinogen III oxidase